ncbi:hypothetical protein [Deinococcus multiflagellatus]|uniref:Uncharacterized protein n=1 Tax=Deinococcus multiflagellatus TaxID=1656887 RepID=A0ABW1ZIM0_9DEIO|nr:hypothetical protein [Deinococcus multiflagellatus]MBZ9712576.1 hypothetical protein [Deinococcus multiflagellatus]
MTEHTPEFHEALERVGVIAQLFDQGVPYDEVQEKAVLQGLSQEQAALAFHFLCEACGYVFAKELGIHMADTLILKSDQREQELRIDDSDDFQAAYYLAYNLRHGGRNDLFATLVQPSSISHTINNAMNSDPNLKLTDLAGAQFSPLVVWF